MQTYDNHRRYNPIHHFVAAPLATAAAIWGIMRFVRSPSSDTTFLLVMGLGLCATAFAARVQALTVQDRLIRLEMALRCARLLPPDLAARAHELTLRQMVSLRFAGDAELPELTRRTLAGEFASSRAIKQAIRDWQPDTLRA
jgi:hypothetical protein